MSTRNRNLALASLALLVLLCGAWWLLRERGGAAASAPRSAELTTPVEPPAPPSDVARLAEEAPSQPPAVAAVDEEPTTAVRAAGAKPDLDAREWITFHVVDDRAHPVARAQIELTGLRRKRERGSWFGWRGDPQLGETDSDGNLRLAYPVWISEDDETAEICFTVRHPDYSTFQDGGRKVQPVMEVVLQPGSVVAISGWIGEPSRVITAVTPEFSWDVDSSPEDWIPRRDGRPTSTRIEPGFHLIVLRHESAEHGLCYSAITEFELVPGEHEELHLELKPARKLAGRLDDEVPRPIVDGHVVVGVQRRTAGARGALLRTIAAPVKPDGTFEIANLSHGRAQIVGLCRGWASARAPSLGWTESETEALDPAERQKRLDELGDDALGLTSLDDGDFGGDYVLDMEPTATLEVTLRSPDGQPAPEVYVNIWPNACWSVGSCGMFLDDRTWAATSDAQGIARIEDLPAGQHSFGVQHRELDLPLAGGQGSEFRHMSERFASGEVRRLEIKLERKSP